MRARNVQTMTTTIWRLRLLPGSQPCDHEHGHDHERREIAKMAASAVLFAVGMVADERMAEFMPKWLVIGLFYILP